VSETQRDDGQWLRLTERMVLQGGPVTLRRTGWVVPSLSVSFHERRSKLTMGAGRSRIHATNRHCVSKGVSKDGR
jgi:hypothetical protein